MQMYVGDVKNTIEVLKNLPIQKEEVEIYFESIYYIGGPWPIDYEPILNEKIIFIEGDILYFRRTIVLLSKKLDVIDSKWHYIIKREYNKGYSLDSITTVSHWINNL